MKTVLRIIVILLVGVLVSGALYLIVENTSLLSSVSGFPEGASEFGERPEMPVGDIDERPEGDLDHHAISISRGLSEIGVSLAKISGITFLVLLVQGLYVHLKKRWFTKPTLS